MTARTGRMFVCSYVCTITERSAHMLLQNPPAVAAYTVAEFCNTHRISRSKLYQLWAAGVGPRFFRVGNSIRISTEAATEFRREREAAATVPSI
jgi:hypothetical protein